MAFPARDIPAADMACTEAARGKIKLALQAGMSIPVTWAADAQGRPTTDPGEAMKGLLLPAAGPKGYGLAVMVEILSGILSGSSFSTL